MVHRALDQIDGACVWLTGLSGAGKSTTARALCDRLAELGRSGTVLDGDELRRTLFPQRGFSKADRDANVVSAAQLARRVVDEGRIAICALVSPYRQSRASARALIGAPHFLEVFVDTPLAVCEERDVKGLYAQARRGTIANFTGIDDPYEAPLAPDLVIGTSQSTVQHNVDLVIALLVARTLLLERACP